jgi:hypothetical protein
MMKMRIESKYSGKRQTGKQSTTTSSKKQQLVYLTKAAIAAIGEFNPVKMCQQLNMFL